MTIDFATLFEQIGKCCHIGDLIVTANADTIPDDVDAFLVMMQSAPTAIDDAVTAGLLDGVTRMQSNASTALSTLVAGPIQRLIIETVKADVPLADTSLTNCLTELIAQMEAYGETLDKSTVTIAVTYGDDSSSSGPTGDNTGDGVLLFSTKRGDGLVNEFILAETLTCAITSTTSTGRATWRITGEASQGLLSVKWPGGSAISKSVTSYTAASSGNLVPTGTFETADPANASLPSGWICPVGVLGTTVKLTSTEQQTVTVNGATAGHYTLSWQDLDGITYTTTALAYNASASVVQAALRALPTLGSVTVTSTGTSPDLTHTVVFTNVRNPAQLTYTSNLTGTGPTITINTIVAGSAYVARGARCLQIVGTGSEFTTLQVPVTLTAKTQYGCNMFLATDLAPGAGTLQVDLVDGIGTSIITDDQGIANGQSFNLTTLTATHQAFSAVFRTPSILPAEIYLRIHLAGAMTNARNVFIDELVLVAMTELYAGGPYACGFTGPRNFVTTDVATVDVANTRTGRAHEWLNRTLGLATKRLLLPTAAPSTNPDATIIV